MLVFIPFARRRPESGMLRLSRDRVCARTLWQWEILWEREREREREKTELNPCRRQDVAAARAQWLFFINTLYTGRGRSINLNVIWSGRSSKKNYSSCAPHTHTHTLIHIHQYAVNSRAKGSREENRFLKSRAQLQKTDGIGILYYA